jgi:RNA polymerase sigma-70 factor (ECF subfamily)
MRANSGQIAFRSRRVTSYWFPSSISSGMPDTHKAGFRRNLQSQVRGVMPKAPTFEENFLPHLDAAYNLARWILGTEHDAQDVVQEAFARAWKGFPKFRGENPRAWLLTIVRNTAYTWIKKHASDEEKLVPFDEKSFSVAIEAAPSELGLDKRNQQLRQALNRLPAEFREVLVLFEIEGWSYKAMATTLEVPLGTVMSRLSRARRRLRAEITQLQDPEIEDEL